jgi:CRP-like cAMP-binding protein
MRKVLYLLGQLSDADVEWLIGHARKQRVAAGTTLIHEGQPLHALFVVLEGVLEVTGTAWDGARVRLGSGEVVGEMSFIEARLPSASVTAVEDTTVLAVPRPELRDKLESDPGFAARFYRALAMFLSHRLRSAESRGRPATGDEDELDAELLNTLHLAGHRFDYVLRRLLAE